MAGTYSAGTAFLQVVPSFRGVQEATKAEAAKMGAQFEGAIEQAIPEGMAQGAKAADREGVKAGEAWAGSFSSTIDKRLRAAFESLPKAKPDMELSQFDRRIAQMRSQIESLRDMHVKAEIDDTAFFRELEHLRLELRSMKNEAPRLEQFVDLDAAHQQFEALSKLHEDARRRGYQAGSAYSGAFTDRVHQEISGALKDLPQINMDVNAGNAEWAIATIVDRLNALRDQSISVHLDDKEFLAELTAIRAELAEVQRDANSIHLEYDITAARERLRRLAETIGREGRKTGEEFAGAFRDAALPRLEAALKSLPSVDLNTNFAPAERALGVLRAEIDALKDLHVRAEIDDATFLARLRYLQAQLEELANNSPDVAVKFNASRAADELRKFADETAPLEAARAGDRAGGAFERQFSEKVRAGLAALPEIQINGDTSDADVALAHVRGQLAELSTQRIGIDLDDTTAMLQIEALKQRLDQLARESPSVRVRAEAAAAAAELAAILKLTDDVDKKDATVTVKSNADTSGLRSAMTSLNQIVDAAGTGSSRLAALIAVGASIGTAIVPAAAAAAAAIAGIGTAAGAAVAGIGVAVLGFSGLGGAIQSLDKYQDDQAKSAASMATSENGVAAALDSVKSAERSLGNTREQVAYASRRAAQAVVDAQRSVTDAEQQALQARKDLTQAYEDARRSQEDMTLSIRATSLAQRQANLDVAKAKQELDAIMANPRATEAEREQARITYEQRVLQLDDLTVKQRRLQADKAKADKAGIEGSSQVQAAQEKVRQATDNIGKSQQRLSEAIESQSQQQRQGAFQIANAQQSLAAAYRQVEQASTRAGVAGGAALDNLKWSMDQLSPAGQRFARFIYSLKADFLDLRNTAQSGMLPGVQRAIETLLPYLPRLQQYISRVSFALGGMFENAVQQLQSPTWSRFFGYIEKTTVPALEGMYRFASNAARGLAALFLALTPFNQSMGKGLLDLSEGFARWAETLDQNKGFQRFLAYVREEGPHVVNLLEQMGIFIVRLLEAAAPIGSTVVRIFEAIFEAVNSWPMSVLRALVGSIATIAGALLVGTIAVKAFKLGFAIYDAFRTFFGWVGRMSTAVGDLGQRLTGTRQEVQTFGFSMQAAGKAAADATKNVVFFQGMSGRIANSARDGMARYAAAITTASGQVGLLAKAHELAGNAITPMLDRYRDAVTTASGRVSLFGRAAEVAYLGVVGAAGALSRAQEVVNETMTRVSGMASAAVDRYRDAVTTASGRVSLFGRAAEVAYLGAVGAVGTLSRAQEVAAAAGQRMASLPAAAMDRYRQAVTTSIGEVGLLAKAHEVAGVAMIRAGQLPQAAMDRYRQAVTTTTGEVGFMARAHEVASSVMQRIGDLPEAAMTRYRQAVSSTSTEVGLLARIHETANGVIGKLGDLGSTAMGSFRTATGNAAVAADGWIAKVGTGMGNAANSLKNAVGGLVGALGGPWGLALEAAALAVGYFAASAAEAKARIDSLKSAALSYGDALRDGLTSESVAAAKQILQQNEDMRGLVNTTKDLGISQETLISGLNGDKSAREEVIDALNRQIDAETQKIMEAQQGEYGDIAAAKAAGKRRSELENMRIAFAKANTANAESNALTASLNSEQNKQIQTNERLVRALGSSGASAEDFKRAIGAVADSTLDGSGKLAAYVGLADKVAASQLDGATKASLFRDTLNKIGAAVNVHSPAFGALSGVFDSIAGSALSASDKTALLKQTLDQLYGAAINQTEADERFLRAQDDLAAQLANSSAGFDLETAKRGVNRDAILRNRDALEAALQSTRDTYVANIANGDSIEVARKKHEEQTQAILNQIDPVNRDSAAVHDLVTKYGSIPGEVKTTFQMPTINEVYGQLVNLLLAQRALQEGITPQDAQKKYGWQYQPDDRKQAIDEFRQGRRDGGYISGPGGPRDDLIPAWLSNGEYVIPAHVVETLGIDFFDALLRKRRIRSDRPGDGSEGLAFADGGLVGQKRPVFQGAPLNGASVQNPLAVNWPFLVSLMNVKMPTMQEIQDRWKYGIDWEGPISDRVRGIQSWIKMQAGKPYMWAEAGPYGYDCSGLTSAVWNLMKGLEPYSHTFSTMNEAGYFPLPGFGLYTAGWANSGEKGGGSVGHTAGSLAGLSFEARGGDGVVVGQNATKVTSFAHLGHARFADGGLVEWKPKLYDTGGMLMPGWNPPIYNGTGKPEPVFNPGQWDTIAGLIGQRAGGGNEYHFAFQDTTLTPSKLRAMQDADAVRARQGRAR